MRAARSLPRAGQRSRRGVCILQGLTGRSLPRASKAYQLWVHAPLRRHPQRVQIKGGAPDFQLCLAPHPGRAGQSPQSASRRKGRPAIPRACGSKAMEIHPSRPSVAHPTCARQTPDRRDIIHAHQPSPARVRTEPGRAPAAASRKAHPTRARPKPGRWEDGRGVRGHHPARTGQANARRRATPVLRPSPTHPGQAAAAGGSPWISRSSACART